MSKKYTTLYMDKVSGEPVTARGAITINIGKMKTIKLPVASSEGWVNELVVKQVPAASGGGTPVGFDIELTDSKLPYYNGSDVNNEKAYNAAALAMVEMFRVFDNKKTTTAGNAVVMQVIDYGYPFINSDQANETVNQPYLYLTIIPNNALDATKWNVSVTTTKDIG